MNDNELLITAGRQVGGAGCSTCEGAGTKEKGLRMQVQGTVLSLEPPVLDVGSAVVLAEGEIGCTEQHTTNNENNASNAIGTGSVWDIILNSSDVSIFRSAVESVNIDKLLSNKATNFTVFAPLSYAVVLYQEIQHYLDNIDSWSGHVTNLLENHIIEGLTLTQEQLFGGGASFTSLAGNTIAIDNEAQLVGGHSVLGPDRLAANGVVHAINDILRDDWNSLSLVELLSSGLEKIDSRERLLQESNQFSTLVQYLTEAGLIANVALTETTTNGTTMLAARDPAFEAEPVDGDNLDELLMYHQLGTFIETISSMALNCCSKHSTRTHKRCSQLMARA